MSEYVGVPDGEQVDLAVEVFRMLADPTRVRILWVLLDGELSVNEIVEALDKPQSAVSQHLAKLRLARLVLPRKQGIQVFYRVANDHVRQLVSDAIHHAEHAGPGCPPTTATRRSTSGKPDESRSPAPAPRV